MIQKKKFSDAIAANISVVEGLLPINGVICKKNASMPSWYLLCEVRGQISVGLHVIANSYQNVLATHVSFDIVAYDTNTTYFRAKFHLRANNEYEPSFKYKKNGSTIKLWCKAGDILALFNRTPPTILELQEPDDDAINITGDI